MTPNTIRPDLNDFLFVQNKIAYLNFVVLVYDYKTRTSKDYQAYKN